MNNSNEIQISSGIFEQIWSSTDLHPTRITQELNRIFTYNHDETQQRNDSQKYFTVNRDALISLTSIENEKQGGLHVNSWFNGIGENLNRSLTTEKSINEIVSERDIQQRIKQQGIEIQWNGEKFLPKSFYVYKLLDIIDQLQVAIINKQLIADKNNGAIIRTVNTLNTPTIPKINNNLINKKISPTKALSKCPEYTSPYQTNQLGDLNNQNLTDDDLPNLVEELILKKQCQEFSLNKNSISDKGLQFISHCLRQNPRLEQLNLNENLITDRGVLTLTHVLINENKNLFILSLENLKLGPTSGVYFARMLTMNNTLTQLLVKDNQLKDRGMNAIVFALQNNISLTKLDIRNNQITDRSFQVIVQLLNINRGLIEFQLMENNFSNETKEQFKELEEKYGINLL